MDPLEVGVETAPVRRRVKVADAAAGPLAQRTPLSADSFAGTRPRAARAARSS